MQRRDVIKNLALGIGGLIALPSWANGWTQANIQAAATPYLSTVQEDLLATIVDTIIPTTDTPGARELGVHTFIQQMVADCYEPKVQVNMTQGLEAVQKAAHQRFGQPFAACSAPDQIILLQAMQEANEPTQKEFYALVKKLTIQGYLNSEYVMTNLTHYEMVPGRYLGCVPVPNK